MHAVLENENELHARIFRFPTSALKMNERKLNYFDFLMSGENEDCNAVLMRIFPRIDMTAICAFVDETPFISDLQKQFYKHYLTARYTLIIKPAYTKVSVQ